MKSKKPTAGIILAAGMSTRLGRSKQLLMLKHKPLLEWVLDACLKSRLDRIVLVLGYNARNVLDALAHQLRETRIQTVVNDRYHEGMSRSLRSGLAEVSQSSPSVMFLLGDQPMVDAKMINLLLDKFWASEKNICVPVHRGRRGNPVIFNRSFYEALSKIENDVGARNIIAKHPDHVLWVEIENPLYFFDVDTEDDLKTLQEALDDPDTD